jgi:hypothetical protein
LLAADFDSAGPMHQLDTRRGFIDFLAAFAGSADKMFIHIRLADPEFRHALLQLFLFLRRDHVFILRNPAALSQLI